jgi:hypothetical protein
MNAINRFLFFNGFGLLVVGFLMYMKPSLLLSLTHNQVASLPRETFSVLNGWG